MSESGEATDLGVILRHLPIGLKVTGRDGQLRFENRASGLPGDARPARTEDQDMDGRVIRTQHFPVMGGDDCLDIALSIDATDQVRAQKELFRQAYFDDLTGLPSRQLVERSISALIETEGSPFAVAVLDLDGFKSINDYYGHVIGDELLIRCAERLSASLRASDLLARDGSDAFVILLSPIAGPEDVVKSLQQMAARLKEPFVIDGFEVVTSASVGVSFYPRNGSTFEALRTNAQSAMTFSKAAEGSTVSRYDSEIAHAAAQKARTEQRLRLAIRDRRFRAAYQPKYDFRSDKITGVEVLLRWLDEDDGLRAPSGLIDLALELGVMNEVSFQVLSETIDQIDRINEAFGAEATISFNVAAKQAGNPGFMRSLIDRIDATGLAHRFILEITEEAFLAGAEFQRSILPSIRDIGARVSIDDFGVGYSSLSALADITADELKVDRSFISRIHERPRAQAILKTIETLASALAIKIVVEGVETADELNYLKTQTGISVAQGFYFSRPVSFAATPPVSAFMDETRSLVGSRTQPSQRMSPARAPGGRG